MKEDDGTWVGITVELWKEIARELDVDYEFKEVDLNGLLHGLEDKTLDVGATGLGVTAAREAKFDFSTPYFVASEAVAVNADQQPSFLQVFRRAFLNWGLITLFLFIIIVMLSGGGILWLIEYKGKSEHYGGKSRKAFGRSLFWSLIVLTGRDLPQSIGWTTVSPTTFAARVFGIIWMSVGVMLFSLFTATAASVLTSKQLQSVINDPQDLRHVKVGTVGSSVGEEYLKLHQIKNTTFTDAAKLLNGLANHSIDAAVYNAPVMSYYAKTMFVNKIAVLRFSLRQVFMAIPVPAGSALRKPINRALLKVIDSKRWQTILANHLGQE